MSVYRTIGPLVVWPGPIFVGPGPEFICKNIFMLNSSTQLSMKFKLLINTDIAQIN